MPDPHATSAEHLKALYDEGKITQEDYETLRAALEAQPSPQAQPRREEFPRRWGKSWTNRQIGGVCGGIAESTGIGAWRVRFLFILAFLLTGGTALFVYLILYILMPWKEPTPWNGLKNLSWSFAAGVILFELIHLGINFFFVPMMIDAFSQAGGALPAITRWTFRMESFLSHTPTGLIFQLMVLGALIFLDRIMPRGRRMRRVYEWVVSWCLLIFLSVEVLAPLFAFHRIANR